MPNPTPADNSQEKNTAPHLLSLWRNWMSVSGLIVIVGAMFSFVLLFTLDTLAHVSNPYLGILTYLITPMFISFGVALVFLGGFLARRKMKQSGVAPSLLNIDFSRPKDRRTLVIFLICGTLFVLLSAIGSYETYHFSESVSFCGQACHTVMKPEFTTYQVGAHAKVACTECHIGPGATWFVRAKLSGLYQVYATALNKYPKPVPTPIANLRPAQETCEQCHWPKKFVGNLDRTYNYFLGEETNNAYSIRMLMRVGGANEQSGPVSGIHWHVNPANKVEYIADDPQRLKIPWIRWTDEKGRVTEFRSPGFTNEVSAGAIRRMDCVDCHNRPSHSYVAPNDAVNKAMSLGHIDPALPWVKTNAIFALTQNYTTTEEAVQKINAFLTAKYPNDPRGKTSAQAVEQIYRNNFFPEMKANWKAYPNHKGHKDWPGCFRCHDEKHKTADAKEVIRGKECNICHIILAQGVGKELEQLNAKGQEFKHPGGDYDHSCIDCHTGGF